MVVSVLACVAVLLTYFHLKSKHKFHGEQHCSHINAVYVPSVDNQTCKHIVKKKAFAALASVNNNYAGFISQLLRLYMKLFCLQPLLLPLLLFQLNPIQPISLTPLPLLLFQLNPMQPISLTPLPLLLFPLNPMQLISLTQWLKPPPSNIDTCLIVYRLFMQLFT